MQEKLKKADPETFNKMDIQNSQRLIRALEVCIGTWHDRFRLFTKVKKEIRNFIPIKIGLNLEKEELYNRINHRVDVMVQNGLIEEARSVYPYIDNTALQTVGYRELFDHFDGNLTLEEAIDKIKQHTRNYAKRQLTWFKKDNDITWFDPQDVENITKFIDTQLAS